MAFVTYEVIDYYSDGHVFDFDIEAQVIEPYQDRDWAPTYVEKISEELKQSFGNQSTQHDLYYITYTSVDLKVRLNFLKDFLSSSHWLNFTDDQLYNFLEMMTLNCRELEIFKAFFPDIKYRKFLVLELKKDPSLVKYLGYKIIQNLDFVFPDWEYIPGNSLQYLSLVKLL